MWILIGFLLYYGLGLTLMINSVVLKQNEIRISDLIVVFIGGLVWPVLKLFDLLVFIVEHDPVVYRRKNDKA